MSGSLNSSINKNIYDIFHKRMLNRLALSAMSCPCNWKF